MSADGAVLALLRAEDRDSLGAVLDALVEMPPVDLLRVIFQLTGMTHQLLDNLGPSARAEFADFIEAQSTDP